MLRLKFFIFILGFTELSCAEMSVKTIVDNADKTLSVKLSENGFKSQINIKNLKS